MKTVKVTTNGRVTIPAPFRKKYELNPGRKVKFDLKEDGIIIPLVTPQEVKNNIGFLGKGRKLLKAVMEEKRIEREL